MAQIAKQSGSGPSLRAYNPPLRELFGNWIYDTATRAGLPANRMRNEGMFLADLIPGLGDAIGAQEAKTDYQAGNYLGAGLGGLATAMGVIPGAGDAVGKGIRAAEQPIRKTIRAFHGSPHDFDKFSMDKIGTGEGAQAYGHGLYFAENEDVARGYRDSLMFRAGEDPEMTAMGRQVNDLYRTIEERAARMPVKQAEGEYDKLQMLELLMQDGDVPAVQARIAARPEDYPKAGVEWFNKEIAPTFNRKGRMYEVEINADPEDFLDWDKPLSEQSNSVKSAAKEIQDIYGSMGTNALSGDIQGSQLAHLMASRDISGNAERAAMDIRAAGIPGIKYMDAGSRGADGGNGTRNFVVFDENLIKIVRKYGIAGAIGAGLITQQQGEAMAAQGYGGAADDKRTLGDILSHSLGGGGGF